MLFTGYPLKLHFQISCVFPVFSLSDVPIYMICYYNMYKTDLADLPSFNISWEIFAANFETT